MTSPTDNLEEVLRGMDLFTIELKKGMHLEFHSVHRKGVVTVKSAHV